MNARFFNTFATQNEITEFFLSIFLLEHSILSFLPLLPYNFSKLKQFLKKVPKTSSRRRWHIVHT
jgi:hypothetical protein